jgi:AcrR family transcriptional regulator
MDTRTRPARRAAARPERPDRQQAILLAAEKLFSQHGYRAVSLRQIALEAGVPLALVGYYYGQKHELFQAIFNQWRGTVDERLALLAEARKGEPGLQMLHRVVEAFALPVLRLRASMEGEYYAILVARELFYRTPEAMQVLADHFDPMAHAFIDALHQSCPGSRRPDAAWAYQFALGALLHHITDDRVERLSRHRNTAADPFAAPHLLKFIHAGIAAVLLPAPAPATHLPSTRRHP